VQEKKSELCDINLHLINVFIFRVGNKLPFLLQNRHFLSSARLRPLDTSSLFTYSHAASQLNTRLTHTSLLSYIFLLYLSCVSFHWCVCVCVCVPDEGQVNPERAVCPGTVDAEKHPVCDARPAGVLQGAVEAHLDTHTHLL